MFSRLFPKKPKKPATETKPESPPFGVTWLEATKFQGKMGLSQCPGKKILRGRNGKCFDRDLREDVKAIAAKLGFSTIVCLLNKFELRSIGVDLEDYRQACEEFAVQLVIYPIMEMAAPEEGVLELRRGLVKRIVEDLGRGKNVLIHCRGGIGRAGTIASCVLLELESFKSSEETVLYLRKVRDKRCVESRKQFDYIRSYESKGL